MTPVDKFRQGMDRLSQALREATKADSSRPSRINVSSRRNVVIAKSIGDEGGVHGASSSQRVHIRQDGQEWIAEDEASTAGEDR